MRGCATLMVISEAQGWGGERLSDFEWGHINTIFMIIMTMMKTLGL